MSKRGWLTYLEVTLAVLMIAGSIIYFNSRVSSLQGEKTRDSSFIDYSSLRDYVYGSFCPPVGIYEIINLTNNGKKYCVDGKEEDISKISSTYRIVGSYLYSGGSNYDPIVLVVYAKG